MERISWRVWSLCRLVLRRVAYLHLRVSVSGSISASVSASISAFASVSVSVSNPYAPRQPPFL